MKKLILLLVLLASPLLAQPDLSNFKEISTSSGIAFLVNAKDAKGTYESVQFLGLRTYILEKGYDANNFIVTAFEANCETGVAKQRNSIGIVQGAAYKEEDKKMDFTKPEKKSPLEAAIYYVCTKKFGEKM